LPEGDSIPLGIKHGIYNGAARLIMLFIMASVYEQVMLGNIDNQKSPAT
jgi:hypothetical protein